MLGSRSRTDGKDTARTSPAPEAGRAPTGDVAERNRRQTDAILRSTAPPSLDALSGGQPGGVVQLKRAVSGVDHAAEAALDPGKVAAHGVAGASEPLPHIDAIQRSFGAHDVSGARAAVGGPAQAAAGSLKAEAYVTNGAAAFSKAPDLHTAAHEAAHVVQQRAGVADASDHHERQADAVADAVVAGRSAERLLGTPAAGSPKQGTIQRKWNHESDATMVWDKPVQGLLWHVQTGTQNLFYTIVSIDAIPEPSRKAIQAHERRAYTYEQWKAAGWSGSVEETPSAPAREPAKAAPKEAAPKEEAPAEASASKYKGAFRAFDSLDHASRDPEFDKAMAGITDSPDVIIGVLDTGIITKSDYLRSKVVGARDAALPAAKGAPKSGAEYQKDIQDLHGTRVAGNAGFGSDKIKLLDVRVQVGQMNGYDNSKEIAEAIEWAIQAGARVITSSVALDWSKKDIQAVIGKHTDVLFLTSGGNNNAELTTRSIDGELDHERDHAMLIGGVTMEGEKHPKRGFGPAVDLSVPSGAAEDDARELSTHVPKAVMADQLLPELRKTLAKAQENLKLDQASLEKTRANPKAAPASVKRAEGRVANAEKEVRDLEQQIATWTELASSTESGVMGESGVSFGLPVVANIAAKMLLINPRLTAAQIKTMLMANVTKKPAMATLSKAQGMVDPEACYAAARASRSAS